MKNDRVFIVLKNDNFEYENNYAIWTFHKLEDAEVKMEELVKETQASLNDSYEYEDHSSEFVFEVWRKGEHALDNVLIRIHELEVL